MGRLTTYQSFRSMPPVVLLLLGLLLGCKNPKIEEPSTNITVRVASFNMSLASNPYGKILRDLRNNEQRIRNLAEIVQEVRPDVLFVQELEYDSTNTRIEAFMHDFLEVGQMGKEPIEFPFYHHFASNAGELTGHDLDRDGSTNGPYDAHGWGLFPNQFGLAIFSKYPIDLESTRTFRKLLWKDFPNPHRPMDPKTGISFWTDEVWNSIRLSSKNHIDVPIYIDSDTLHILGLHPQNGLGDGSELRNSLKNYDELGFFSYYLNGYPFKDDKGRLEKFNASQPFVIVGDFNSNPVWNGSLSSFSSLQLLNHPKIHNEVAWGKWIPSSRYGRELQKEEIRFATRKKSNGILERIDYVLPSANLKVVGSGIYWPSSLELQSRLFDANGMGSDHRLVYVDIEL